MHVRTCRTLAFLMICGIGCFSGSGCKSVDTTPLYAEWSFGTNHYEAYNSSLSGNEISSDCDNNNKMFIYLGSIPTASTNMNIVSYSKTQLAANELRIDIAHGANDYLSTGNDNKTARVLLVNGKMNIYLDTVSMRDYGSSGPLNDSVTVTGYLDQQ